MDKIIAALLQDIHEQCQMGLNSANPKHWEAALQDVMKLVHVALKEISG